MNVRLIVPIVQLVYRSNISITVKCIFISSFLYAGSPLIPIPVWLSNVDVLMQQSKSSVARAHSSARCDVFTAMLWQWDGRTVSRYRVHAMLYVTRGVLTYMTQSLFTSYIIIWKPCCDQNLQMQIAYCCWPFLFCLCKLMLRKRSFKIPKFCRMYLTMIISYWRGLCVFYFRKPVLLHFGYYFGSS